MAPTAPLLLRVYIYGGLASTASIALTLICAVIICPALSLSYGENILSFLVALAVGCLTGDAIFHLLPHVFLSESMPDDAGERNLTKYLPQSSNAHEMVVVWRAFPIACTIFFLYFVHVLSDCCRDTKEHGHSHFSITQKKIVSPLNDTPNGEPGMESTGATDDIIEIEDKNETLTQKHDKPPVIIWMIVIGDVIHSFSDGVAIGGSYAKSFYGGLGTTVAIVCHEIPHGVGNFAVMVTTGLTQTRSFCLLTFALSPMYLGMLAGSTLSQLMDLTRLIFAVSSGMFLFISLVEMLPRILERRRNGKEKWKLPVLHTCGIFFGMLAMYCIAILEGKLNR